MNKKYSIFDNLRKTLDLFGILGSSENLVYTFDTQEISINESDKTTENAKPCETCNDLIETINGLCAIDTSDTDLLFDINRTLPSDQLQLFSVVISDALHNTEYNPSFPEEYCMKIELTNQTPIFRRPRRLSHQERIEVREIIDDLLSRGIIRPSNSPYASAIVPVRKRDNKLRKCVDYRPLNKFTLRDNYPLPLPDDCLEHLGNKKFFSLMDMKSGFNQIKMHEDSIKYTSFVTQDGQYEYLRVPYGLKNGPAVFQRFVHNILRDLIYSKLIIVYMDDILVASVDLKSHIEIVGEVIKRLRTFGLELNLKKCTFGQTEIEYLGYCANASGIRPGKRHLEAIQNYPIPKNTKQVHSCHGLFSVFRRFVPNFSTIAFPLKELLKKDTPFKFTEECREAFLTLRQKLIEPPILSIFDPLRPTELHCDASARGFGAAVLQKQDDTKFHPIAYFTKATSVSEAKLHSYELETLAIVYALKRFKTYFDQRPFKIITDCDALTRTLANETGSSKIDRWALFLEKFNYTVQHRPGKTMGLVDALSRIEPVGAVSELDIDFQLQIAQSRDPEICSLRLELENSEKLDYELRDGIVYQISSSGSRRLYVPREMINNVIRWTHEKIGHLGIDKCCAEIKKHYWFPLMKTRVHNFIRNCLKCIVHSAPARTNKRNLYAIPKIPLPFDTIHIDHLGPLPSVISKKKYVLLVIDAFTKFTKLYATATTNSKEACTALQDYFDNYSRPRRVISDRGTSFSSNEFENFLSDNNVQHILNATASPQANGQVERVNRVLTPLMSKSCTRAGQIDWSHTLRNAEYILNNTVHTTTKHTPSELLFGVAQRGKTIDELTEHLDEQNSVIDRDLLMIRQEASENIKKSQEDNLNRFLKHNAPAEIYKEGDYVAIRHTSTTPGSSKKLDPKFRGPYEIHKVLPHDRYVVRDVDGCQITQIPYNGILEANKLRKWVSRESDMVKEEGLEETLINKMNKNEIINKD